MPKRPDRWAHALFAFALLLAVAAVTGALLAGLDREAVLSTYLLTNTAIGLSAAPCGLLIARARPENPIGWLFLVAGVAPLLTAAATPGVLYGAAHGWPPLVLRLLVTTYLFAWSWGVFCCLFLVLQLFPSGTPLTPRWCWLVRLTVANALLGNLFVGPTPELGASSLLLAPWWQLTETVASVLTMVILVLSVASLVLRFVRGGATVRRQLLWLLVAVIAVIVVNAPIWFSLPVGAEVFLLLSFPLIPLAVTIAVLRHDLYDVRAVLSRLLVYVLLTAGVIAAYVGTVAVLDRVLRGAGAPVLATLAIALAFGAVRSRLQRVVDRAVYGVGRDPVAAMSAVGRRLAGDDLRGVVEALREALRLPYAALEGRDGSTVASGDPGGPTATWPLVHRDEPVGALVLSPRRGERRLSRADAAVIDLVAAPLALGVHALALTEDLRASRERVIDAAEEERGRLRRELHDSLGPVLTGAALKADGIALAVAARPGQAETLALELADQLRQSVAAVRQIVYGLRPAALDELGLAAALRREATQLASVRVTVDAPEPLAALPPSVEVAAYRIATEALTNVVRHSDATRVALRLAVDGSTLTVTVTDDGRATGAWTPGVGLASMSARASEVGGACQAGPTGHGGRVVAVLPVTAVR